MLPGIELSFHYKNLVFICNFCVLLASGYRRIYMSENVNVNDVEEDFYINNMGGRERSGPCSSYSK